MDTNVDEIFDSNHHLAQSFGYYGGTWLPHRFHDAYERIHNLEIRDDDTWVCSFPKSGTTWTQEMVWCIANDLDFKRADEGLLIRFPWLERDVAFDPKNSPFFHNEVQDLVQLPSPRFIKTHLPFHLLPKQLTEGRANAKIVYVYRNPKDSCISFYHYSQYARGFNGTFEKFCELFLGNKVIFAPYWEHVIEFWERKTSNNIHFLKYEDMKKDLRQAIGQTATFLNKSLTDDQVRLLEDHLSFDKMKSNPAVNFENNFEQYIVNKPWAENQVFQKFMRKGKADQWKTEMSTDMIKKFDDWTTKHLDRYPELKREFSLLI